MDNCNDTERKMNDLMSGNSRVTEIALELLEKYMESELSVISEYSCDIEKDKEKLREEIRGYLEKLDKRDYYHGKTKNIRRWLNVRNKE